MNDPSALWNHLLADLDNAYSSDISSDIENYANLHLRDSFLKKFQGKAACLDETPDQQSPEKAALLKFIEANKKCSNWSIEDVKRSPEIYLTFCEMRSILNEVLWDEQLGFVPSYGTASANVTFGPGKSTGVEEFSFYHKVGWDNLTASSQFIISLYYNCIKDHPSWDASEKSRSANFGEPNVVQASSLTTVPKNHKINRTICVEPSLNMLFQQGIGKNLSSVLANHFGIRYSALDVLNKYDFPSNFDFSLDRAVLLEMNKPISDESVLQSAKGILFPRFATMLQPEKNKELARIGSITGEFATFDLSSASDTISLGLVKALLPKEVYNVLEKFRCKTAKLKSTDKTIVDEFGEEMDLHMFSSMGNGYTFPLETLIFTTMVRAVYKVLGIPFITPNQTRLGNFGVFGDDIIVVRKAAGFISVMLEALGFIVNKEKTFVDGNFRESCGGDYFKGIDVRGVYLKKYNTLQDEFVIYNLLAAWSQRTGIPLPKTFAFLWNSFEKRAVPVPMYEPMSAGIRCNLSQAMDPHLFGRFAVKKLFYRSRGLYMYLYRRYEAKCRKFRPRLNPHTGLRPNEDALYLASLKGELRDGIITTRSHSEVVVFNLQDVVVPNWDNYDLVTAYLLDMYGLI